MNIKHSTSAFRQYKAEKRFQSNWKMIQIQSMGRVRNMRFIYTDINAALI